MGADLFAIVAGVAMFGGDLAYFQQELEFIVGAGEVFHPVRLSQDSAVVKTLSVKGQVNIRVERAGR